MVVSVRGASSQHAPHRVDQEKKNEHDHAPTHNLNMVEKIVKKI